jgi:hypothetical protein
VLLRVNVTDEYICRSVPRVEEDIKSPGWIQ